MKRWEKWLAASALIFALNGCTQETSAAAAEDTLNVYFFNAGKADAVLLYTDDSAVLIDTGLTGYGSEILSYMKQHGISSLDYLIITHFDKDHVGGAAEVLEGTEVSNVLVSDYPKTSEEYAAYSQAMENKGLTASVITGTEEYAFELDGVRYSVDGPDEAEYEKKPSNNSSLITSVVYGDTSFLFAGDAQNKRVKEYLETHTDSYDVLKVPYHGYYQKRLKDLLAVTDPDIAVITCSQDDGAEQEAVDLLQESDVTTYKTSEGAVHMTSDGKTVRVGE